MNAPLSQADLIVARTALNAAGRGAAIRAGTMALLRQMPLPAAIKALEASAHQVPLHRCILRKLRAIEAILEAPQEPSDEW